MRCARCESRRGCWGFGGAGWAGGAARGMLGRVSTHPRAGRSRRASPPADPTAPAPRTEDPPMKRILALLPLLALAAACADQAAPLASGAAAPVLARSAAAEGEYIVVLEEGANPRSVAAVAGIHPRHVYTAALTGFA